MKNKLKNDKTSKDAAIIGVDIGGTNFRIGCVTSAGEISNVKIVPSNFLSRSGGPATDVLSGFISRYIDEARVKDIACVSVGLPATIDKTRKIAYSVPNIVDENGGHVLDGLNIVDSLQSALGIKTLLDRDTNFLLAYDMLMYDIFNEETIVGCYIGTGFGGSIRIGGKYLIGKNGVANEIGHIPYYKSALYCACGKKACAECYASGRALELLRRKHYPGTPITDIFEKHGKDQVLIDFVEACALPVATQANIFDPDCIIIGGGVVNMRGFPKDRLTEYVLEHTRKPLPFENLKIIYSHQCKDMGVIGAAIYAIETLGVGFSKDFTGRIKHYAGN